jgi:hypothetical protein
MRRPFIRAAFFSENLPCARKKPENKLKTARKRLENVRIFMYSNRIDFSAVLQPNEGAVRRCLPNVLSHAWT